MSILRITDRSGNDYGIELPEDLQVLSSKVFVDKLQEVCPSGNNVVSAIIPDSVTCIGDYVFAGCTGLTEVTIPDSVTSIGRSAFHRCTGLTTITIPNSVTSIGDGAFHRCTGLTTITIPDSVTSIVYDTFSKCTGLTEVIIPDSVTSIGDDAFSGCTGLTAITIPDSVTSIGHGAFYECTGLTEVIIPDSVTSIGDVAFLSCTGLTTITIPNSVTSIGDDAFSECTGLQCVMAPIGLEISNLPSSVRVVRYSMPLPPSDATFMERDIYVRCIYKENMKSQNITDQGEKKELQNFLVSTFFNKERDLGPIFEFIKPIAKFNDHYNTNKDLQSEVQLLLKYIEGKYDAIVYGKQLPTQVGAEKKKSAEKQFRSILPNGKTELFDPFYTCVSGFLVDQSLFDLLLERKAVSSQPSTPGAKATVSSSSFLSNNGNSTPKGGAGKGASTSERPGPT